MPLLARVSGEGKELILGMADLVPGLYERLVTEDLDRRLQMLDPALVDRELLAAGEADEMLVRHLAQIVGEVLRSVRGEDATLVRGQVEMANRIAVAIAEVASGATGRGDLVAASHDALHAIGAESGLPGPSIFPRRPETPLSTSALLVNGRGQPRIGIEVQRELDSADRVDLLCAFVMWNGLRVIDEQLETLTRRGGSVRVITTTYIGATERRALDRLVELGAEVKISYETRTTRLHAKAWLFHRRTGYTTAYIGSSNLSRTALLDGLEWNVRLSSVEQGHLLDTFRATFDQYWEDPAFEPYDPADPAERSRLDEALAAERGGPTDFPIEITTLDVRPWGYQREILDELTAEREVHASFRNLVVMATGTGKTVVAGLDYRRLRDAG